MAALFHIIIRILGLEIPVSLPRRPQVGETVTLKVRGQRIPMVFDGMGFFQLRKVEGTVIPADAKPVVEEAVDDRSIPQWALDSDDPRIEYLVEQSGFNRTEFDAMLYASAWKDALLIKGDPVQEANGLYLRWAQLDARQSRMVGRRKASTAKARFIMADNKAMKDATSTPRIGKQDAAGKWLAALGQDDPVTPEDAVIFKGDDADREALSDLVSTEAERDGDWGVERPHVDWQMDVIGQLLAHAGMRKAGNAVIEDSPMKGVLSIMRAYAAMGMDTAQEIVDEMEHITIHDPNAETLAPLADVLATLEAKRELLSEKQLALADRLLADTEQEPTYTFRWANMIMPDGKRERREIMTKHVRINALARKADACEFLVDEALDEYENVQAAWDEEAHPRKDNTPKVEVSPERQLSWLEWLAAQKSKGGKPWLERPSYISVLSYAFETQARTPTEAHNRAYNADSLRYPSNVVGYDGSEFIVKVNRAGQVRRVPAADARVAYPHLPAAAKARLNKLAKDARSSATKQ